MKKTWKGRNRRTNFKLRWMVLRISIERYSVAYGNSRTSECGLDLEIQIITFSALSGSLFRSLNPSF